MEYDEYHGVAILDLKEDKKEYKKLKNIFRNRRILCVYI